jgi:hypothetical protein
MKSKQSFTVIVRVYSLELIVSVTGERTS